MHHEKINNVVQAPRILLFDTSFFRSLLKNEFLDLRLDAKSELSMAIEPPFTPWRSAFAFMEWIGLKSKSLPKPPALTKLSVSETDYINLVFEHYERHYNAISDLNLEHLENLARRQRRYVCDQRIDIWDSAMSNTFGEFDVSGWLRFSLTMDALLKHNTITMPRGDYWSELIARLFFDSNRKICNLSKLRLAYLMWTHCINKLNYKGAHPEMKVCINDYNKMLKLHKWEDHLDCDLVHVACCGVVSKDGARHKIDCVTFDKPDVLIGRINLYKGFLSHIYEIYCKQHQQGPPNFDLTYGGNIFCFNPTGNLVRKIDVSTETQALKFLGDIT